MDQTAPPTSPPSPPSQPAGPAGAAPIQTSAVPGGDQCANCGAPLAGDQRYCLQCGQRRGDPRLPFMDAVVLMDAVQRSQQGPPPPPPAKKQRSGISPNAALITGIGVLLLALGLGVLIGRSGDNSTTASAPAAPQVITVNEGGGGSGGGNNEGGGGSTKGASTGSTKAPKSKQEKAAKAKEAETQAGAEEVLKPEGDVKLPPAKVQPGGKCESGASGCKNGEFTGEFFGE